MMIVPVNPNTPDVAERAESSDFDFSTDGYSQVVRLVGNDRPLSLHIDNTRPGAGSFS